MLRKQLRRWKAKVAEYAAKSSEDELKRNCVLCRLPLDELCSDCRADEAELEGEECMKSFSSCQHAVHLHCLSLWLQISCVCPICSREWDFKSK